MMGDALKLHSLLGHWFPWLHFPLRPGFRQPNETLQICKLQIIYLQRYDLLLSYPSRLWYFHKTSPISKSAPPPAPLNKNKAGVSIVVHKKLLRSTIMISQQRSFSSYCLYIIQVSHAHMVLPENAPKGQEEPSPGQMNRAKARWMAPWVSYDTHNLRPEPKVAGRRERQSGSRELWNSFC